VKHHVNILACALVIGALAAPAAQAGSQRPPVSRHHAVSVKYANAFTNLGREGSGLQKGVPSTNAFTNLGHEGSGLMDTRQAAFVPRPWA
jgi:hypothetical protein